MTGDDTTLLIDEERIYETEFVNAGRDLGNLLLRMLSGVPRVDRQVRRSDSGDRDLGLLLVQVPGSSLLMPSNSAISFPEGFHMDWS